MADEKQTQEEGSPRVLDLSKLSKGFKATQNEKEVAGYEPVEKSEDEQLQETKQEQEVNDEEVSEESYEEEAQEVEEEESEDEELEDDSEEEDEEYEEETEEDEEEVISEDAEEDQETEEESEESDEIKDTESEPKGEQEEFDVYDFTDGVFESKDDLKKTSDLLKSNPELKKMLEFYEENGTLLPYLHATQINVDDFSDTDVLKDKFRSEHQEYGFSNEEIDRLFREDVLSKYHLDDEDENRVKVGLLRMKKDAGLVRKELKEEQKKLLLPKERDASKDLLESIEENSEKLQAHKNKLGFQIRKQVKDGKIDIKVDKDNIVKMSVSPKKISALIDNLQSVDMFTDESGEFDLRRMVMMTDPDSFIKSISTTYESEGKKKFVQKELKNRNPKGKKPKGTKPPVKKKIDPTDIRSFKGAKVERVTRR